MQVAHEHEHERRELLRLAEALTEDAAYTGAVLALPYGPGPGTRYGVVTGYHRRAPWTCAAVRDRIATGPIVIAEHWTQ